jgi:hypothetical protein
MLLVIFGAGASYDSAPSSPPPGPEERPPLASQLFEDRPRFADALRQFSRCQPLVPRLRQPAPSTTIEQMLQEYQSQAGDYPERHRQLAAVRYYLHFIFRGLVDKWESTHKGITNYKTLLDDLERWRLKSGEKVCLVTFNYDTLLERAMPVVGMTINSLSDYISNSDYKIIKVHGSADWGHEIEIDVGSLDNANQWQIVNQYIDRATEIRFTGRYYLTDQFPIAWGTRELNLGSNLGSRFCLFPAIALPLVQKSTFECPNDHLETLRECVRDVSRILVIGWRAQEEHFLKLLRDNLRQPALSMVIAGGKDEANQIGDHLLIRGITARHLPASGGFSSVIRSGEIDQFLRLAPEKETPAAVKRRLSSANLANP